MLPFHSRDRNEQVFVFLESDVFGRETFAAEDTLVALRMLHRLLVSSRCAHMRDGVIRSVGIQVGHDEDHADGLSLTHTSQHTLSDRATF